MCHWWYGVAPVRNSIDWNKAGGGGKWFLLIHLQAQESIDHASCRPWACWICWTCYKSMSLTGLTAGDAHVYLLEIVGIMPWDGDWTDFIHDGMVQRKFCLQKLTKHFFHVCSLASNSRTIGYPMWYKFPDTYIYFWAWLPRQTWCKRCKGQTQMAPRQVYVPVYQTIFQGVIWSPSALEQLTLSAKTLLVLCY